MPTEDPGVYRHLDPDLGGKCPGDPDPLIWRGYKIQILETEMWIVDPYQLDADQVLDRPRENN